MNSLRGTRPSPALLIAALALVVALAGTAVAGPSFKAGLSSKEEKEAKKIAKAQAKKQAEKKLKANVPESHVNLADKATDAGSADDADKLDGLDANQIARATTAAADDNVNDFNAPDFTDVISKTVTAPTAGILYVTGSLNVNRDIDDPDPALLQTRIAVDGIAASTEANVRATQTGDVDQSVSPNGAVAVAAGDHTVALQALEAGDGMAFITERSVTTIFVPFGNAGTAGVLAPTDRSANE